MERRPLLVGPRLGVTDPVTSQLGFYVSIPTALLSFITFVLAAVTVAHVLGIHSDTAAMLPAVTSVYVNGTLTCVAPQPNITMGRRTRAYNVRLATAYQNYLDEVPCQERNMDDVEEEPYAPFYSKGLDHDSLGHANPTSYAALLKAVRSSVPSDFDAIPLATGASRGLLNPQAALAYSLVGGDSYAFTVPPALGFESAATAAEAVELYWMARCRDVPFADYASNSRTLAALAAMDTLTDYRGPPLASSTLFRGDAPGCDTGPYVSQFLYKASALGVNTVDMTLLPPTESVDFMTDTTSYLQQQEAQTPLVTQTFGVTRVYISTLRHLARYVQIDVAYQAYLTAATYLLGVGAPLKPGIPNVANQAGYGTWGAPDITALVASGVTSALKAAWAQKWIVHRRVRPEEYGSRVHNMKTSAYAYALHMDILNSTILDLTYADTGTYLLPQAYPEGAPLSPSYPSGHAVVAGMATTMLKALFVEDTLIDSPVMPNGATLDALSPSADLTVGGELNKLAWNMAMGRCAAGVNWRSDASEGLALGERMAMRYLRDLRSTAFAEFSFVDFSGNVQVV